MTSTEVLSAAEARQTLTPADIEVIEFVASGFERDAIAARLGVSRTAVNRHIRKAFELTGAVNAANLVTILSEDGRLPLGRARVRARAEAIVSAHIIAKPVDETERHVNDVLIDIARVLGSEL
jgi:DNA-binding CsgD family transcriptional regulator